MDQPQHPLQHQHQRQHQRNHPSNSHPVKWSSLSKPSTQLHMDAILHDRLKDRRLQIGDEIILLSEKNAMLFADGQVKKRAYVLDNWFPHSPQSGDIGKAVFRIEPQLAYREAKAFKQATQQDVDDDLFFLDNLQRPAVARDGHASDDAHLEALKQAAILEAHSNEIDFMRVKGQPVTYGSVVQLFNIHTGRYLSINSRDTCYNEPTAMPVEMERYMRRECLFRVMPKFRIRAEGEHVRCGDVIVFKSIATEAHLSAGKHRIPSDDPALLTMIPQSNFGKLQIPEFEIREASATMYAHAWTMKLFRSAQTATYYPTFQPAMQSVAATLSTPQHSEASTIVAGVTVPQAAVQTVVGPSSISATANNRLVQGGKFITFYHKEKSGYLSCPPFLSLVESTFISGGLDEQKVQLSEYHFDALNPQEGKSCLSMWQIENAIDPFDGESIEWGTPVRLRHATSSMYLSVRRDYDFTIDGTNKSVLLVDLTVGGTSSSPDKNDEVEKGTSGFNGEYVDVSGSEFGQLGQDPTVFVLRQVNTAEASKKINTGSYLRIQHLQTGTWMHPVSMKKKMTHESHLSHGVKSRALSGHGHAQEFAEKEKNHFFLVASYENRMDDYFTVAVADPGLVKKFNFVQSYVPWIMRFVTCPRTSGNANGDVKYPISKGEDRILRMILTSLIYFCSKSVQLDPFKREGTPLLLHQTLLKETSIIDILVKFLTFPFTPEDRLELQIALFEIGAGNKSTMNTMNEFIQEEPSIRISAFEDSKSPTSPPLSPPHVEASANRLGRLESVPAVAPAAEKGLIRNFSLKRGNTVSSVASAEKNASAEMVLKPSDLKKGGDQDALARIFRYIYRLIKQFLLGSEPSNQGHLANKFMILSEHVDLKVGSADALMQLIDGNPSIVKKISERQIENFITLLARDRNPSYINFLIAMCSCDGVAMPSHQLTIARKLFGPLQECMDQFGQWKEAAVPGHLFCTRVNSDSNILEVRPATELPEHRNWVALDQLCLKKRPPTSVSPPVRRRNIGLYKKGSNPSLRSESFLSGSISVGKDCIPNREEVAEYFEAMLRLYRALCIGQNTEVITLMTRTWRVISLTECHVGLCDENLPHTIRALYADLIRVIYVDRYPIAPVVSDYVFPLDDIAEYPTFDLILQDADTEDGSSNTVILTALKQWIPAFLAGQSSQLASNIPTNNMILSILKLTKCLVHYGYFKEEGEIKSLFRILMHLLDSNTDFRDEDMAVFNSSDREKTNWWLSERFEFNENSQPIIHSKIEICTIMEQLLQLRLEMRCYLLLHYWHEYFKPGGKRENLPEIQRSQKLDVASGFFNLPKLLSTIMDETAYFRLRDTLTPILLELLRFESPKLKQSSVRLLHRLFSSIEELVDISRTSVILNDEDHIQAYFWLQSRVNIFTDNGVGTTAADSITNGIIGGIKLDVALEMKNLLEDAASLCIVGSKVSGDGLQSTDRVVRPDMDLNSKFRPDKIMQAVLRNNSIHKWVISMLKNRLAHALSLSARRAEVARTRDEMLSATGSVDSRGSSEANEDFKSVSGESLDGFRTSGPVKQVQSELLVAAFEFLFRFTDGNKQHQRLIFEHLDLIIESTNPRLNGADSDSSKTCVDFLCQMISQSPEICSKLTEHHISLILDLSRGVRPEYIRLARSILRANGRILKKNQTMLLKAILENKKKYLHINEFLSRFKTELIEDLQNSNADNPEALDFILTEVEARSKSNEKVKGTPKNAFLGATQHEIVDKESIPMEYFIEIIYLLAECCEGKNYMMQLMSQNLLSTQEILVILNAPTSSIPLKNSLACLIVSTYVEATGEEDNEKHPERIRVDDRSWAFLEFCTERISQFHEAVKAGEKVGDEEMKFLFGGIMRFTRSFFRYCQTSPSPERPEAEIFAESLIDNLTDMVPHFLSSQKARADDIVRTVHSIVDAGFAGSKYDGSEYESWIHGDDDKSKQATLSFEQTADYFKTHDVFSLNAIFMDWIKKVSDDTSVKFMTTLEFKGLASKFLLPVDKKLPHAEFDKICGPTKAIIEYLEQSANGISLQTVASMKRKHRRAKKALSSDSLEDIKYDIKTLKILEWLVTEELDAVDAIDRTKNLEKWMKANQKKMSIQSVLNQLGCTLMAERLVTSERVGVFSASLRVLIVLLEGGNRDVQNTLEAYWLGTREERFFFCMHDIIKKFTQQVQESKHQSDNQFSNERLRDNRSQGSASINGDTATNASYTTSKSVRRIDGEPSVAGSGGSSDGEFRDMRSVMRLLQLLVEGHNFRIQEYMRTQPDNIKSFNLIKSVVEFLHAIVSLDMPQVVPVMVQVFDTLIDLSQGCIANQVTIFKSKIVQAINSILLRHYGECPDSLIMELKMKAALCLSSLLEDDTDEDTQDVFRQMAVTLDFRSLLFNLESAFQLVNEEEKAAARRRIEEIRNMSKREALTDGLKHLWKTGGEVAQVLFEETKESWREWIFSLRLKESQDEDAPIIDEFERSHENPDIVTKDEDATELPANFAETFNFDVLEQSVVEADESESEERSSAKDAGFVYSMLIATLMDKMTEEARSLVERSIAFDSFNNKIGRIEIVRELNSIPEKRLFTVLFPIPDICFHLQGYTKERFLWMRKRDTPQDKIEDFVNQSQDIIYEIKNQASVEENVWLKQLTRGHSWWWRSAYLLTFLINVGNMMCMIAPTGEDHLEDYSHCPSVVDHGRTVLGWLQIIFWILSSAEFMVTQLPLLVNRRRIQDLIDENARIKKENEQRIWAGKDMVEMKSVQELQSVGLRPVDIFRGFFMEPKALYHAAMVFLAVLGLEFPSLYAIHLLDFMYRDEVLQGVIASVTLNWSSLSKTVILGVIIIYIYSVIGFIFFRHAFDEEEGLHCHSLLSCFLTILSYGLRSGGGIGELLETPVDPEEEYYAARIILDLSFFLVVIVFLLNVVFGIIFDTFGQLREERKDISDDLRTTCFVCSINASEFQRHSNGFENHIRKEHNVWNYLFFLVHLELKDKTEYTSHETFVSEALEKNDLSFFPIQRAMALKNREESDNVAEKVAELEQTVRTLSENASALTMRLNDFQGRIR